MASVIESSPENTLKSDGTRVMISAICEMSPDASFTPMMFGIFSEPRDSFRQNVDVGARRHVVKDDRKRASIRRSL